jgi:hypothetical protein
MYAHIVPLNTNQVKLFKGLKNLAWKKIKQKNKSVPFPPLIRPCRGTFSPQEKGVIQKSFPSPPGRGWRAAPGEGVGEAA